MQRDGEAVSARRVIDTVAREIFIPDEIFVRNAAGWLEPLRRVDDPAGWRERVAADAPIVTRVAPDPALPEGVADPATGRGIESTSSSSAPFVMARMIDALELRAGMRVLEIGTGTGFNAAVLARIAGAGRVVSVERDAVAAGWARTALEASGSDVRVVIGDGAGGYAPGSPYERVIATASVHDIPYAWIEQTRPGGLLVIPLAPTIHPEWPLAVLTVHPDGTASGRCVGTAPFMPLDTASGPSLCVDKAEERWERAGRPDPDRYGITVTPEGQAIWLDAPEHPVAP